MRYAKLLASTCAVAAFAATAFASVPAARKSAIEMSALAWTIPLPGYVFRAGQFTRVPQTSEPLSASDCTRLGGEVNIFHACGSGRVCSREDESGKTRGICLSKS
jgi:hypothetical protein